MKTKSGSNALLKYFKRAEHHGLDLSRVKIAALKEEDKNTGKILFHATYEHDCPAGLQSYLDALTDTTISYAEFLKHTQKGEVCRRCTKFYSKTGYLRQWEMDTGLTGRPEGVYYDFGVLISVVSLLDMPLDAKVVDWDESDYQWALEMGNAESWFPESMLRKAEDKYTAVKNLMLELHASDPEAAAYRKKLAKEILERQLGANYRNIVAASPKEWEKLKKGSVKRLLANTEHVVLPTSTFNSFHLQAIPYEMSRAIKALTDIRYEWAQVPLIYFLGITSDPGLRFKVGNHTIIPQKMTKVELENFCGFAEKTTPETDLFEIYQAAVHV